MNPIRERVLDEDGRFKEIGAVRKLDTNEEIQMLKGELLKVKKALKGKDEHWDNLRSVDYVKAVDSANAKAREADNAKREIDRMDKAFKASKMENKKMIEDKDLEIAKLSGQVEQLKKEVSAALAEPTVEKKKPTTKKK